MTMNEVSNFPLIGLSFFVCFFFRREGRSARALARKPAQPPFFFSSTRIYFCNKKWIANLFITGKTSSVSTRRVWTYNVIVLLSPRLLFALFSSEKDEDKKMIKVCGGRGSSPFYLVSCAAPDTRRKTRIPLGQTFAARARTPPLSPIVILISRVSCLDTHFRLAPSSFPRPHPTLSFPSASARWRINCNQIPFFSSVAPTWRPTKKRRPAPPNPPPNHRQKAHHVHGGVVEPTPLPMMSLS